MPWLIPMIYLDITSVASPVDTGSERQKLYAARAQGGVETIFQYHLTSPELTCTLESVARRDSPVWMSLRAAGQPLATTSSAPGS